MIGVHHIAYLEIFVDALLSAISSLLRMDISTIKGRVGLSFGRRLVERSMIYLAARTH